MTEQEFDLARFKAAQDPLIDTVLQELRTGRKRTHWMWFVFPQLRGLGRSPNAAFFGIESLDEARAYLAEPILEERLRLATDAVLHVENRSASLIFGSPDDQKFHSSMTLFDAASASRGTLYDRALDKYFGGRRDRRTLDLLGDVGGA